MTYYNDTRAEAFGFAEFCLFMGVPCKLFKQSGRWWVTVLP